MKVKTLLVTAFILIGLLVFWIIIRVPNTSLPNRPFKVPNTAVWKGEVDEGFWFDLINRELDNKVRLRIYNDYNGDMVLDADFTVKSGCKMPRQKNLLDSICYFEFNKIILLNGCELYVVYPVHGGSFDNSD